MLSTKDSHVSSVFTASAADSDHVKRVTGVKFGLTGKEPLKWVVYRANVRWYHHGTVSVHPFIHIGPPYAFSWLVVVSLLFVNTPSLYPTCVLRVPIVLTHIRHHGQDSNRRLRLSRQISKHEPQ